MRRGRLVVITCIVVLLPLFACQLSPARLTDDALREAYYFEVALGSDTLTFASFAAPYHESAATDSFALSVWRALRVGASATLGELGYGTGPFRSAYSDRERGALKRFQADLSLPVTGALDSLTISHLVKAQKALALPDIFLPGFFFSKFGDWVFAYGTWRAETNALGYPVNTVDIQCDRQTGECDVARVDMISEELNQVGRIMRQTFHVVTWTDELLVAKGEELPGSDCHGTLTIHFPTKEVILQQWCTGDSSVAFLAHGPSKMTLRLVDGTKLASPFDAGDLKEVHEKVYKDRERNLALKLKNSEVHDINK
jgi:hypothetical protein